MPISFTLPVPGMAALRSMRAPIWKALIPKYIRRSRQMPMAYDFFSGSSRRRAEFPAIADRTSNSMHEGGELGYSMVHAFGAAFDNPDLIVACVIGDGESETCPLEGSWKSVNFLNPVRDGAVLPILHLNGYKISGPTVQGRTSDDDLRALYIGRGYKSYFVECDDPEVVHQLLAGTLDDCYAEIRAIQQESRQSGFKKQPIWPMIVLRTPKGMDLSEGSGRNSN